MKSRALDFKPPDNRAGMFGPAEHFRVAADSMHRAMEAYLLSGGKEPRVFQIVCGGLVLWREVLVPSVPMRIVGGEDLGFGALPRTSLEIR